MNFKSGLLLVALLAVTHYGSYWYGSQKPAEIRTVEKEIVKKDVITQIVEVLKPDGTKETKTIIVDKSTEKSTKNVEVTQSKKDWLVGAYYKVTDPAYGITVNRRILGPVFLNVSADTGRNLAVGVGLEF
jgi:hypothetical protein